MGRCQMLDAGWRMLNAKVHQRAWTFWFRGAQAAGLQSSAACRRHFAWRKTKGQLLPRISSRAARLKEGRSPGRPRLFGNRRSLVSTLNIFCRLCGGNGFGTQGQKRTEKQNEGAPKLGVGEALVEYPRGKRERAGGAKQLQRLGKRDADLANRDVIQNVGEGNAADG